MPTVSRPETSEPDASQPARLHTQRVSLWLSGTLLAAWLGFLAWLAWLSLAGTP